jgi:hypothetical protein
MSDQIIDEAGASSGARPTFLTVLCILTWIGAGLGFVMTLLSDGTKYVPVWYTGAVLACHAITAYGAYAMWNLKKSGLMIYTAGEGAAIILPYILIYGIFGGNGLVADMIAQMAMIGSVIMLAFIVMYWANAKYLK